MRAMVRRWLKDEYLRLRAKARVFKPVRPGPVTIAGFFSDPRGVAQAARLSAEAFEHEGFAVVRHDIGDLLRGRIPAPPPGGGGVLLVHANPPETVLLMGNWPTATWADRYRIGYWVWELETPPPSWRATVPLFDELWTPSTFSAGALRKLDGAAKKVRVMPHPLMLTPPVAPDRARFGFGADETVVLTAFDLRSTSARKNPEAAIAAYFVARPSEKSDSRLVLKVLGSNADAEGMQRLRVRVAGRTDVTVIDAALDEAGMSELVASADILLSMHRSEGFGLLPAQAMLAGKAVVATGWSAVMDYLDADSAALVPYRLIPANDPSGLYALPGARWADPDVEQGGASLRCLIEDPDERRRLGAAALAKVSSALCGAYTRKTLSQNFLTWAAARE